MNFVQKLCNLSNKSQFFTLTYHIRTVHKSKAIFTDAEVTKKETSTETFDILEELREPELTEEEILQKRFKARLPERIYRIFVEKEAVPIEVKRDFQMNRLRKYYARHGSDSKLNPGICWPSREEIVDMIEFDRVYESPLHERIKNVEEARLAEEKRKREVEEEVDKNMANLDKWIADFHGKKEKKNAEMLALKLKKERLVEEISEYLGYEIDPHDPRFQEAVDQREKEKKKALKAQKKQESYDKMIAKLRQMAEKSS